ncbi:MAG: hypothetical protein DDT42_01045 [candidate division WS2 bacterium]|uniref:VWFA domain-containing protein n=1 Tax=Psychracetigena formicireducens TaxID=2986056 RepID=A0A9E2BGI7_PSYF1|nr:hypothetical protein [Candidatus Psychracetigena formicireducens]
MKKKLWSLLPTLRAITLSLLVLAVINPSLEVRSSRGKIVVLVDESRSVRDLVGDVHQLITPYLENIDGTVMVVPFARSAFFGEAEETTNFEEALTVALGHHPQTVLLVSDMMQTSGEITQILPYYKRNHVPLYLLPLEGYFEESLIKNVEAPSRIFRQKPFPLKVEIYSTERTQGILEVKIYSPETVAYETLQVMEVSLLPGFNSFSPTVKVKDSSYYVQLKVSLRETVDTWTQNNEYQVSLFVDDSYPLLLLYGEGVNSRWIDSILTGQGFEVDSRPVKRFPLTYEELMGYRGVILLDVAATDFKTENILLLTRYLKEQGRGMITIGGGRSFGLGGYKGSALEELLPVSSEVQVPHRIPEVALLVAMDASGSMATEGRYGTKLELAKEGVRRALNVLSPDDLFSLIAFRSKPELILPFGFPLKEREKSIDEEIESLQAGGGTNIIEALKEAAKSFTGIVATNKQLLLISDGIAPEEGLEEVLLKLKDQKVEVVAIGVGQDANLEFLRRITSPWGGKVYYSPEGETLPEIASREVGRIKASYLHLKPFSPERVSPHNNMLKEVSDKELRESTLSGYLRTTLKEGSQMILATPLNEPLVAVKRVGLGKSLAYTADGEGRLSGEFLNSSTFIRLLAGMVRELFLQEYGDVEIIGEKVVYYSEPPLPLNSPVMGTISGQAPFQTRTINFTRQGINSFKSALPELPTGSYFLRLTDEQGALLKEVPVGVAYPKEYLITSENFILPQMQNQEGVTVLSSFKDISGLSVPTGKNTIFLRFLLVVLSMIFFLLELSLRMLGIRGRDILKRMFPKRELPTREEIEKRKRFLDIFKGEVFR